MRIINSELIVIRHKNVFVELSCGESLWLYNLPETLDIITEDIVLNYLCSKVIMVSMFALDDNTNEIDVFVRGETAYTNTRLFTIKNPTQEQIDIVKDEYQLEDKELIRKVLKESI